jgi:hypothetical protein
LGQSQVLAQGKISQITISYVLIFSL